MATTFTPWQQCNYNVKPWQQGDYIDTMATMKLHSHFSDM